jgi:hypothetical protein
VQEPSRFRFSLREFLAAVAAVALGCMWPALLVFIVPLLMAAVLSRLGKVLFVPVLLAAAASVAIGAAASLAYWGYAFHPPKLLAELRTIVAVEQLAEVTGINPTLKHTADIQFVGSIPPQQSLNWNTPWELMPTDRILQELGRRKIGIASQRPISTELAEAMWQAAEDAGILIEKGEPRCVNTKTLNGFVGVARVSDGSEIAFATVAGDEYTNDHYPYYELVFRLDNGRPRLVNYQMYFVDIAGNEGMTWLHVAVPAFLVLGPLSFLFGAAIPSQRRRLKAALP